MLERLTNMEALLKRAILFLLLLCVLPFAILIAFCNPAYDDYGFAATVMRNGFIRTQTGGYRHWSGRYFSTALLSLSPITFGNFTGYKVAALIIILLSFTSIFSIVTAAYGAGVALTERLILSGLIVALFSNQMPDLTEGYYWMSGSVSYILPSALTMFFFALTIRFFEATRVTRVVIFLSCLSLIFAIVGSSETSMIILLFLVSCVTVKAFMMGGESRRVWLILLTVTVLCALVVIFSPGNAVRSKCCPDRHAFFFSIGMSIVQEARYLSQWLTNPALILSTILYIPVADSLSQKSELLKNHFYLHPAISSSLLLAVVFLGFFLPYWATGMLYQQRTVNMAYFFFLIAWFLNLSIWVGYLKEKRQVRLPALPAYVYCICLPVIFLSLLCSNNTGTAVTDLLSGRAYRYDSEVRKRRTLFEQCAKAGIKDCQMEMFNDPPETISNPYFESELNAGSQRQYWEMRLRSTTFHAK